MARVVKGTKMIETYSRKHHKERSLNRPVQREEPEVEPFPTGPVPRATVRDVPIPPFLVPAIVEALSSSKKYGSITKVMPGEAEVFLAKHVQSYGGLVLSSDSDLLVHDLGPTGAMTFLGHLETITGGPSPELSGLEFVGQDICRQLGINRGVEMVRVAYELETHPEMSLEKAVRNFKSATTASMLPESYAAFLRPYNRPEVGPEILTEPILLDPRISEIVLRSVGAEAQDVVMYLPILIDNLSRPSAWISSTSIRALAYAHLHLICRQDLEVMEIRRPLSAFTKGTRVHVLSLRAASEECERLFENINLAKLRTAGIHSEWIILTIFLELASAMDDGTSEPLVLEILRKHASGRLDTVHWDFIHFSAQIEATLYSFRMLRQIIDVVSAQLGEGSLSPQTIRFRTSLASLPSIADFPSLRDLSEVLSRLHEEGAILSLLIQSELPDGMRQQIQKVLGKRQQTEQNTRKVKDPRTGGQWEKKTGAIKGTSEQPCSSSGRTKSTNPFDVLSRV